MPHNAAKKNQNVTGRPETFSQVNQVRTEDWNQKGEAKRNRTAVGNWEGSLGDSSDVSVVEEREGISKTGLSRSEIPVAVYFHRNFLSSLVLWSKIKVA